MTFSDYSHKDFVPDFNGDEYTANAVLRKDGWDYYELSYDGVKRASEYLDEANDDFQKSMNAMNDDGINLRKEDNPAIRIFSYKPEYDEDGDMQPSYECVFHGTLEEAKQDERFKDFDIENNVRQSECKYANQQDFENLYTKENAQSQKNSQEFTQENANSQSQNQENSRTNDFINDNINDYATQTKEEREQEYSNFDRRNAFEQGLNGFDTIREQNKPFDELNKNYDWSDEIDKEMAKNQEAIEEKERELALKQKKLEEEKNKQEQKFKDGKADENDPLANAKKELRDLQEKQKKLEEDKIKCKQAIQDNIADMFAAKDIYDIVKALLTVYRKIKEARQINETLKLDKERMKELDEMINGYKNRLSLALNNVGLKEEAKILMNELTKDLHDEQKKSAQDLQILRKEKELCDELSILFKQRKNTANLDKNGEQIEKMMSKIQKECPNFEKHYNNSFKQAMGIIKEREQGKTKTQSQTQYQGRSA